MYKSVLPLLFLFKKKAAALQLYSYRIQKMIGNNNIFIVNTTHYSSIFHFIFKFFLPSSL